MKALCSHGMSQTVKHLRNLESTAVCIYLYLNVTRFRFFQCTSRKIDSGITIEGLSLKLKKFADWICHTCHVGWLGLWSSSCVLIASVSHALWADWICGTSREWWFHLLIVPCGWLHTFPVPSDSFSLHDSWLRSNLHENHLHQHVVPNHTDVGYTCGQIETRLV